MIYPSPELMREIRETLNSRGFMGGLAITIVGATVWQLLTGALHFADTVPQKLDRVVETLETVATKLDSIASHNGWRTAGR